MDRVHFVYLSFIAGYLGCCHLLATVNSIHISSIVFCILSREMSLFWCTDVLTADKRSGFYTAHEDVQASDAQLGGLKDPFGALVR